MASCQGYSIQSTHAICVEGVPRAVHNVRKGLHQSSAADAESLSASLPDGDECEFYDCSDTVQESHRPNAAEAGNICDYPGGPIPPQVPDKDVPHLAANECTRNPEQAEPGSSCEAFH